MVQMQLKKSRRLKNEHWIGSNLGWRETERTDIGIMEVDKNFMEIKLYFSF